MQEDQLVKGEPPEERYHVFTYRQKFLIVILVSCAATFSPLASNIYFPALELISREMDATKEETALTITVYMIAQGLAPSVWGPIADCIGRRQVLVWTLLLFLLSNIGLALSPSIPVLTALRFFQAAGCSSTISIGAGVNADVAPASERGGFTGTFAGVRQVSVAIGPVIGGIVAGTLGFRAVFWFLAICAGVVVALLAAFLAETLRCVAGDGSFTLEGLRYAPLWRRAAPWRVAAKGQGLGRKRSRANSLQRRGGIRRGREVMVDGTASSRRNSGDFLVRHNEAGDVEMMPPPYYAPSSYAGISRRGSDSDSSERTLQVKVHPATPQKQQPEGAKKITWKIFFEPAKFLLEKDVGCTLFFGAIVYTVFSMVTSSTTFLLADYYGLDTLQIGLAFLPNGIGCALGSYISGIFLDRDFRLTSLTYLTTINPTDPNGAPLTASALKNKSALPATFPLERARLAQLPLYVSTFVFSIVLYGFSFSPSPSSKGGPSPSHLSIPLLAQFTIGLSATAILNVNNTLTVDLYPGKGAAATAVNNLARCLVGAVGVAVTELALDKAAPAVVFGGLAGVVVVCAPAVVAEWVWGMGWRAARAEKMARREGGE
ncbi:putative major facilitator superfamily transporter protein [Botryosphaeria dothidea]|uniref:Major facilitator superfamily transporter protein n=1 Tax=Botryosphaeria dothidea TaxID=55169 RepID=A0A8H4J001_9PEZI|nr:putative major facilitator superfamily transporter protein [Botryosphaeria dothidea]